MKSFLLAFLFVLSLLSCKQKKDSLDVILNTSEGEIVVELYADKAPKTVAAFLKNVDAGVYDECTFYRVLKSDPLPTEYNTGIIQGGVHFSSQKKAPFIPHESTKESGLSHTDGIVSMARTTPGSASTEFFICIGDQSPLDCGRRGTPDSLGMAAFGKVIGGMQIVRNIQNKKSNGDMLTEPVIIHSIKRH